MATRTEFGEFLRARRERVTPAEAGLPAGGRRRTPGLRREELAMLAGISVDYLVRLEQGRETSPSSSVVRSLADALGLGHDELVHMYGLVARHEKPEMCPNMTAGAVSDATRALLDRLAGTPAFVVDVVTDVLALNDAYEALARPTGLLDVERPNLTRFTFRDERARRLYRDWEAVAREQVGNLRVYVGDGYHEGPSRALVDELSAASPEFVRFWSEYAVGEKRTGVKLLHHPTVGDLDLAFTALGLPDLGSLRMVTYLPADEASAGKLDRLLAPPRAGRPLLRVVEA